MIDIEAYLSQKRELIDKALKRYLPAEELIPELSAAMHYSATLPGKKIRPILVCAAYEASYEAPSQISETVLAVAVAIEFIHVYSLIHDDLPAMDNDDYRRGKPTSHKVFGEAVAILTGDALLTLAFEILAKVLPAEKLKIIMLNLSGAMGINGMVGGQVLDLLSEGKNVSLKDLSLIHSLKTGKLILAAVICGAILAEASLEKEKSLRLYAEHLGLAFQIMDDILDVSGTLESLGKDPQSDLRNKKATYPGIVGIREAQEMALREARLAIQALASFDSGADPLREIVYYLLRKVNLNG